MCARMSTGLTTIQHLCNTHARPHIHTSAFLAAVRTAGVVCPCLVGWPSPRDAALTLDDASGGIIDMNAQNGSSPAHRNRVVVSREFVASMDAVQAGLCEMNPCPMRV